MKNNRLIVSILLLAFTAFSLRLSAAPIQLNDGWSFNYVAVGTEIVLTEVGTSGGEHLIIPATVNIDGVDYTIISLKNDLFKDNTSLKTISISSSLISLGTEIATEEPSSKPFANNPITLTTPVSSTDTWFINAVVNTGGESFNQWGTALFASGEVPNTDHYPGGFQFWLNNGTSNNNGRILYKYGNSSSTYTFSDQIVILPEGTNDVSINLTYDRTGKFTAILGSGDKTEKFSITPPDAFVGFDKLSSAISAAGTFSKLEINRCAFGTTAGSISGAPNLTYITVDADNTVYSSINGSLYDAAGTSVLVDLSAHNQNTKEPILIDNWSFDYVAIGTDIALTEVVTSGDGVLTIPGTVKIDDVTYTVKWLNKELFEGNTELTEIDIPATVTSLDTEISAESPATTLFPVELTNPVLSSDIWVIDACLNTGGESFNQWGTALFASGEAPSLDDYTGGFQFWLNNGTAGGENSKGTIVYKYGGGATKHTFSDAITIQKGSKENIAISLAYNDTEYTAKIISGGVTENFTVTTGACTGFSKLSSAVTAAGSFSELTITKINPSEGAGSLVGLKNLAKITVDAENTVYSSKDGSLYNKSGETILVDLGGGTTALNSQSTQLRIYSQNGKIVIEGLNDGDVCRAYTLSGTEVDYESANLPAGIYIITVNGISYKIIM
ncbi:hypothetical protein [Paludibacter sp. 221]|uniref:hypothetical protein n=1 Tax=Paludibacter sp. 221 TaxID=2302939 RepID=UPI0013D3B054|nr:hypothetical protein [Paludibacter sp. 221]